MSRSFLPIGPGKMTQKKLVEMRRQLILAAIQDYKLFGYRTESVLHLERRIKRAKEALRQQ